MKPNPPAPAAAERADLRLRAEAQWRREHSTAAAPAAPDDQSLVHALQVHAIELEMQNEELRASRAAVEAGLARYTELYDFAPVGYFELDRQGVIGRLNLAAAGLLGAERASLIGRRLGGYVDARDRPALADFLFRVWASSTPQVSEVRIPLAGHLPRTIEIRATRNDDGLSCLVVAMDITARQQAEQALLESEQRWRLALDAVGDGLWDWDVPGGQVVFSGRWKAMLGFAEHEIGTDLAEWSSRVHPEDLDQVMADVQAHLDGRTARYSNEQTPTSTACAARTAATSGCWTGARWSAAMPRVSRCARWACTPTSPQPRRPRRACGCWHWCSIRSRPRSRTMSRSPIFKASSPTSTRRRTRRCSPT